jgi:hypothetical protein
MPLVILQYLYSLQIKGDSQKLKNKKKRRYAKRAASETVQPQ